MRIRQRSGPRSSARLAALSVAALAVWSSALVAASAASGPSASSPGRPAPRSATIPAAPCSTGADQGPITTGIAGVGTEYEVAYRGAGAANGCLITATQDGTVSVHHLGLAAGTAPSITLAGTAGYETAFQANTGVLWTSGHDGNRNLRYGMAAGTSAAITTDGYATDGYQIAFQADTGRLWMTGTAGTRAFPWGMAPGTSPSISEVIGGGFRIAFQADTGHLWITDVIPRNSTAAVHAHDLGLGMMAGTSPSVIAFSNSGGDYQVAFQANTAILWSVGAQGRFAHNYGMAAGTSPYLEGNAAGYEIAFQTNVHSTYLVGPGRDKAVLKGLARDGSSPSFTIVHTAGQNYGFEFAYAVGNGSDGVVRAVGARTWDYPIG